MIYNYAKKQISLLSPDLKKPILLNQTFSLFLVASATWATLLVTFHNFPELDIVVASTFFSRTICVAPAGPQAVCGYFPFASDQAYVVLRKFLFYVPIAAAIFILALLIHSAFNPRNRRPRTPHPYRYSLALIAFALGPGLLVNVLLKGFSGRPRPNDTDLFGGIHAFMPAGIFDGACPTNCSFVSGEAASAGWVICLIPFLPKQLQPYLAPPIIAIGVITPALRIFFGGHYLSDAVLGWLLAIIIYAGVFGVADLLMRPKFDGKKH